MQKVIMAITFHLDFGDGLTHFFFKFFFLKYLRRQILKDSLQEIPVVDHAITTDFGEDLEGPKGF